jgi:hypothetical protein
MAVKGGCEAMVHGIRVALDVHSNWMVLQMDVANVVCSYVNAYNHRYHHIQTKRLIHL